MSYTKLIIARNCKPIYGRHLEGTVIGQSPKLHIPIESHPMLHSLGTKMRRAGVEKIDCAAMQRTTQMYGSIGIVFDKWPKKDIREELNEQCLGELEGQPKDKVFAPGSKTLQGLLEQGADYCYPGVNESGISGESTRDVVRRMSSYVVGLRADSTSPVKTIMAISDQMAQQSLFGFIELGGFDPGQSVDAVDKRQLLAARLRQPDIGYCALSSLILEGTPDNFRCRVEYIGQPFED